MFIHLHMNLFINIIAYMKIKKKLKIYLNYYIIIIIMEDI